MRGAQGAPPRERRNTGEGEGLEELDNPRQGSPRSLVGKGMFGFLSMPPSLHY